MGNMELARYLNGEKSSIPEMFGSMVFNDSVMREKLPKDIYKELKKTIKTGAKLNTEVANAVATAMKDWAIDLGATHFTHWFQPMTGITAEKHDSFIAPIDDGKVIMEFSGKMLIQGEPDASSFPSGGLRATFEARGYTAWDPTSPAFVKEDTLCIPTAFCSYGGEVLDKKTPLLRSMQVLSTQALRILRLFGNKDAVSVSTTVGPEQEYFLVDQELFDQRPDLLLTGRTLFGAKPPKGQELEDHYFGVIKPRVKAFMADLDEELWKLGILSKTEHNEVAPAQHEMAPIFSTTNVACDQNQLTMELLKKVAARHGLACLLHEKPFAGVNGSGKHNNWSMATDLGENLLEPGKKPQENLQFLLFLSAIIRAVHIYSDLLRVSSATAGNDHRLGANEAPPAIVSVFLGDELTAILEALSAGKIHVDHGQLILDTSVAVLPPLPKDNTDRNRTSPFAFTGNKFEFRAMGSAQSISCTNMVLNTAVAEILAQFADRLEKTADFTAEVGKIIVEAYNEHRNVVFNGNSYDESWPAEAARRGLNNYRTTPEAIPHYTDPQNVALLTKHGVLTGPEIESRTAVLLENYIKVLGIEAQTMLTMAKTDILPAAAAYSETLVRTALKKKALSAAISTVYEEDTAAKISQVSECLYGNVNALEQALLESRGIEGEDLKAVVKTAKFIGEAVVEKMNLMRENADTLETLVSAEYWPYPTYSDLLFRV
ncbi:MAG: glutamine synthetase III [Oscillospiraceae bacterium]|jgi:glutamine synthetase|nr:glutamine synthetase III [Oscillospiraceae bacterium]